MKRYRDPQFELDPAIRQSLVNSDHEHIVGLERTGRDGANYWELLEYIPHGNLIEYRTSGPVESGGRVPADQLMHVVRELSDAIDYTHNELGLVHCDIKPDNILVRTREPNLDLVLADFGLVTPISVTMSPDAKSRTPAYAPPEAIAGAVSPGRDWWSLGMVILEALTGSHPFSVNGRWLAEDEITGFLATRAVPVDRVADARWQNLCRGLLTRNPDKRWSRAQVDHWLDGGTPRVHDSISIGASQPYDFDGRLVTDFALLAREFRADWRNAARRLADPRRVAELAEWLADAGAPQDAIDACSMPVPGESLDYRLALLIVRLAPDLPPILIDQPIDQVQLALLCRAVIDSAGEGPEAHVLEVMRSTGVLGIFGRQGALDLDLVNTRWGQWIEYMSELIERFVPQEFRTFTEAQSLAVDARLLLCLLNKEDLLATRSTAADESMRYFAIEWYRRLADSAGNQAANDIRDVLLLVLQGRVETIAEHAAPMPQVEDFRVSPDVAVQGGGVWITWRVSNAEQVRINAIGVVASEGRLVVAADRSQSFWLEARNRNGSVQVPSNWLTVLRMPPIRMPTIPLPGPNLPLQVDAEMIEISRLPTPFAQSPPVVFLPQLEPEPLDRSPSPVADLGVPAIPLLNLEIPALRQFDYDDQEVNDEHSH